MSNNYTFIDVFSGCGGLSFGLEQAGLKCLLGIDHDKDAIETFKLNHKNAEAYCGDVRELKNSMVLDLLQGFSSVGSG